MSNDRKDDFNYSQRGGKAGEYENTGFIDPNNEAPLSERIKRTLDYNLEIGDTRKNILAKSTSRPTTDNPYIGGTEAFKQTASGLELMEEGAAAIDTLIRQNVQKTKEEDNKSTAPKHGQVDRSYNPNITKHHLDTVPKETGKQAPLLSPEEEKVFMASLHSDEPPTPDML